MAAGNDDNRHELSPHISELIKVRKKLKESEDEFRRIISEIPISMSVISPEGEILLVNRQTVEIFAAKDEETLKRINVSRLWEKTGARDEWLKEIREKGSVSDFEVQATTLSGEHRILLLSGLTIVFEGRPCILSVHQDITDKRAAENELRLSREMYRSLVENISEILFVIDINGIITYISPNVSSIVGYLPSELIGSHYTCFVHPDDGANRSSELESVLSGEVRSKEFRILKKYGGYIWIKTSATLVIEDGKVTGIQGLFTDITNLKEMEEEIRRSEMKYRDLADNAPVGIVTCDRNGRITYVNSKVPEMLNSPSVEATMKVDLFKTGNIINSGFADILKDVIDNGTDYPDLELKYNSVWGKEVYLRIHVSPIFKGDIPDGARLIIDDVTLRKEAEALLERTQFAFDHSPDEIYFVNPEGRIIYANAYACNSFGIINDGLINRTIFDINPQFSPESWEELWSKLVNRDYVRLESVHRHPDGTEYPVDIIKYLISYGDENYCCTLARDITERKLTDETLRESEGRLRTLIQTIPDLIWLKDKEGRYLACNSTFELFSGAKESEIIGKDDYYLHNPKDADFFREMDRRAIETGRPSINEEWLYLEPEEREVWLETIKAPIYDSEGEVAGVIGVGRDITERKKSADALKEVNRKLSLLSSITRHDILNQITVAAGFLELLRLDGAIPPGTTKEEYFKNISDSIQTIRRQILFTGYYKDMGEQVPGWFDVGKAISDVSGTSSLGIIRFRNDIENVKIFADPLFEKVIYNLIDNAVKHGDKITELSFYTEEKPDELIIYCEDDGIGIPEDAKEKIFLREFFKNSGLGLFLSREILAITGLTIKETGTFGDGARFEIHVPHGKFIIKSPEKGRYE